MQGTAIDQFKIALDGWKNVVIRKTNVERLARERSNICECCEHRRALTCGLCGCPLAAKQRALDATCPDRRW